MFLTTKDENVSMPTVTVCPRRPDYSALVTNYVNKYYNRTQDPDLYNSLRAALIFEARKTDNFDREFAQEIDPEKLCHGDKDNAENGFVDDTLVRSKNNGTSNVSFQIFSFCGPSRFLSPDQAAPCPGQVRLSLQDIDGIDEVMQVFQT